MVKKLLTFLTLLTLFFGVGWAETAEVTFLPSHFSGQGTSGSGSNVSAIEGDITIASDKGYGDSGHLRVYSGGKLTISSTAGNIVNISITCTGNGNNNNGPGKLSGTGYTAGSGQIGLWQGTLATSVTLSATAQVRITKVTVTYETGGTTPEPTTYALTLPTGLTGGTVTATGYSDLTAIPSGTSMTVTATPSSDSYELDWMKANGTEVSNPYNFNITANTTITAAFKEKSVTPGGDGYFITFGDNGTDATTATTASILKSEYTITGVEYVDSYEISNFVAKGETGLKFASNKNPGTLTINLSAAGQAINAQKVIVKAYGSNKTMNVTINNGTSVSKTVTSSYANYEFDANGTISTIAINAAKENAIHVKSIEIVPAVAKTYDVTVTQAEGGTITASPVGEKVVDDGDKINVTATPNPGYELTGWTITGASESAPDANNQITATGNVTITATFALAKNEIAYTIAPANSGEVWLQNGATYDQSLGYSYSTMGTTVSIALAAYPGYDVNSLAITDATGATVPFTKYNSEWNNGKWVTYYTFVMPATAVNIAATFKSGDIYILGTANDNPWDGNKGVKMTYDAGTNTYSADVYFASETATGKGQFSFASNLSGTDGNWNNIGKRWGAQSQDYDLVTNAGGGNWTENNSDPNRFTVPYGVYTITVNWGTGLVTATKKDITVTLDKAAGQLETGTTVNVVSNLTSLLQACKSGVSATLAYSTDNGTSYTDGSSFPVNQAMTAKGKAYYGAIEAESDAYTYTVVTHYSVTTECAGTYGNSTVTADKSNVLAGETVTLTVTVAAGYQFDGLTTTGITAGDITDNGDGTYTFTMPANAVTVVANFSKADLAITTNGTHCTITAPPTAKQGDPVSFTVTPQSDKYEVTSYSVTFNPGNGTATVQNVTDNGNGSYSFNMVAYPVTINVVCSKKTVAGGDYVKVTKNTDLTDGQYLIVYEETPVAFNGALSTLDANDNNISVTITDNKIPSTAETDAAAFTINVANGTIMNASGKYIGRSADSNGLDTNSSPITNTISIDNSGNADIIGAGGAHLRYNSNSGSYRFRYFKASTYTNQKAIALYKKTASTGTGVSITPNGGDVIGTQSVTIDANSETALVRYTTDGGNTWTQWATCPVTFDLSGNVNESKTVTAQGKEPEESDDDADEIDAIFTFVAPNAPTITPASCSITSETQSVTITSSYADGTIEYSTDGGTTWNAYTGQFNVVVEGFGESATVQARVTYNGVTSEIASATYTRSVQPVVFSPASGEYYHNQTCQMFSTTKGARIYYTTDGSEPVMNQGTTQLYTGEIEMTAGNTYNFKAVAYIGTTPSEVTSANYTILTGDYPGSYNYLYSVAELNAKDATTTNWTMVNPVQVVYMSTYQQNGYQPEYCLVRDNTGYGMIYFGKQNTSHNNYKIFEMGDWISGGYYGPISNFKYTPEGESQQVTADTHPELGTSTHGVQIHNWSSNLYISNSTVLPEYLDIPTILSSDPTDASKDYWGHYVHLRKNTVALTEKDTDNKWSGIISDENGNDINYYDKFYLQCDSAWTANSNFFTGHPNRTFDVYGFVAYFRGDYQISPFDFAWIDKPIISHATDTYYEPQTVTISSPDDPTATIWYKTSEMDDYAVYTEPFTVNSTTTIEWYATKQSQYNDELESLGGSITMTFEEIAKPVITPESQVKAVGESVAASIAYEEGKTVADGAVIMYTTDGSDPKTSATAQVYTIGTTTLNFTTTTTVRAITKVGNLYSAEAEARTYTFVKSNGIEYTLVTDVRNLNENGVYVIVSQNYNEALSTTQNDANRGAAGVMFVEDTNKAKVYGNDDVAQFTLTVLTHDEDTSPERHFLMQTNNSNVNGYLHVGHDVNNTLMTEAEEDAMGNDVAVITIDTDGRAHIHFNYAGGDNRYLQYWNRDRLFNTYKTEYDDRAVYIYGVNATPLATIEKEGVTGNQYTIADELIAVHYVSIDDYAYLWCKDQGNVSIAKTEKKANQIDYMREVSHAQSADWDQSNWVVLKFKPTSDLLTSITGAVDHYLKPASITGTYTDDVNFTITMPEGEGLASGAMGDAVTYTPNVFSPANFLESNLTLTAESTGAQGNSPNTQDNYYFFMNPKIQEVATVTYAVWNGSDGFVIPKPQGNINAENLNGAFTVNWKYNNGTGSAPTTLTTTDAYRFKAAVQRVGTGYGPHKAQVSGKEGVTPSENFIIYPLDLTADADHIVTSIKDVADVTGKAVAGVKYYNLAGMESDKPFEGVNIIVTTYTDGSRSSAKVLK